MYLSIHATKVSDLISYRYYTRHKIGSIILTGTESLMIDSSLLTLLSGMKWLQYVIMAIRDMEQ